MKPQSRLAAMKESLTNICVGIGLSTALNAALLPLVRDWPLWQATALMVAAFTAMSFARSYVLRRIFEQARQAGTPPDFQHVMEEIAAERLRQIAGEGFSLAHDDLHTDGALAAAGAAYAYVASLPRGHLAVRTESDVTELVGRLWPAAWDPHWAKFTHARRNLVKSCALLVAEIGRIDRATARKS